MPDAVACRDHGSPRRNQQSPFAGPPEVECRHCRGRLPLEPGRNGVARIGQRYCSARCGARPWSERRNTPANRDKNHRRRARRRALPSVQIDPIAIFERDHWTCYLCAGRIDPRRTYPDPDSASLDHVIPLAAGGHHVPSNVAATHLRCNRRKGARAA